MPVVHTCCLFVAEIEHTFDFNSHKANGNLVRLGLTSFNDFVPLVPLVGTKPKTVYIVSVLLTGPISGEAGAATGHCRPCQSWSYRHNPIPQERQLQRLPRLMGQQVIEVRQTEQTPVAVHRSWQLVMREDLASVPLLMMSYHTLLFWPNCTLR